MATIRVIHAPLPDDVSPVWDTEDVSLHAESMEFNLRKYHKLSDPLCEFLGVAANTWIHYYAIENAVLRYIQRNHLLKAKGRVEPDAALAALIGSDKLFHFIQISAHLKQHFIDSRSETADDFEKWWQENNHPTEVYLKIDPDAGLNMHMHEQECFSGLYKVFRQPAYVGVTFNIYVENVDDPRICGCQGVGPVECDCDCHTTESRYEENWGVPNNCDRCASLTCIRCANHARRLGWYKDDTKYVAAFCGCCEKYGVYCDFPGHSE